MSPALLTLARAYMALPGAPKQEHAGAVVATGLRMPERRYRTPEGILWTWDDETTQWLPDLTDDATGGAMLRGLPTSRTIEMDPGNVTLTVFTGGGHVTGRGATLAEAVARVAVALGRAG
jgi:hypothetical protein